MTYIRLLDDKTIQQIAAGEMIDRPASIVKELVENSMDAESNTITVEIKNGGKKYIRVTDNGDGIKSDDIGLAFQRHSTSKLNEASDLYNIQSFGFRGEALASISAVSRVELLTKTRSAAGIQAHIKNGQVLNKKPVGCPNGTTIIVEDIFYNFPVRRDFLKSNLIESNRITDVVTRLAIGNPNISFKYIKDDRVIFKTPGKGDLVQNIYSVLGGDFKDNLIGIEYRDEDIDIGGFISKNSFYRSNRVHQYLYVNNRFIKNNDIRDLIEESYKSLIPINRYPIYFLFLNLDPSKIDVNIHPTKEEINFVNQNKILKSVKRTIDKSLKEDLEIQEVPLREVKEKKKELPKLYESSFFDLKKEKKDLSQNNIKTYKYRESRPYNQEYNLTSFEKKEDKGTKHLTGDKHETDILSKRLTESSDGKVYEKDEEPIYASKRYEFANILKNMKVLGNIFNTYILAEDKINENLILVDQHAAHERINYENYIDKYRKQEISTQYLISPEVIELTDIEKNEYDQNIELFSSLGFSIESFGGNSLIIRGVPIIFGEPDAGNLFYDILDKISEDITSPYDVKLEKIIKIACSQSIKGGDRMDPIEVEELISLLLECENPFTCPHGRPTIIKITKKEIEKYFKRIM